ncbi:hypothetical protein BC629DRAFT_1582775 [Irpex lacteus]|nr:hypothetical protein BC629DRAFT_1582775 [Irpex lacteus]
MSSLIQSAIQWANPNVLVQPVGQNLCEECQARPKRVDGARKHDYCGQTCAQKAAAAHSTPRQNGVTPNPNGCSSYRLAEKSCLYCRKVPKQGDQHFCGQACANEAMKKGPLILEVPEDHETFKSVKSQFMTSWRLASKPCPPVRYIYKIVSTHASMSKYNSYRDVVEARGQFKVIGRALGNENRRWHGTKRACRIGDKGHTNLCSSTSCSLWGAFGTGIYTSSAVSNNNTDAKAPLKAVLLNKVIVGRGYKMSQVDTTLKAPPAGFDSVLAEKGSQLDDDELVVYRNDAIRPSYLVMYDAQ